MGKAGLEVTGAKEFRRDLKAADKAWPKELAKLHREIAVKVTATARGNVAGLPSKQQRAAAGNVRARGSAAAARIAVVPTASVPWAKAAIWGAEGRSGWFADPKFTGSGGAQFPSWVGSSWEAGGPGGPYGVNAAIRTDAPWVERKFLSGVDDVYHRAFPNR